MDICVRCGACADKCHFYLGSGDPKNMPVLRAELLRSIYRREFTTAGKIFKQMAGGRELTEDVIKEWFSYFYQCTECRRCSVFCPYGIDTAEITMMGRELLHLIGVNTNWILEPVSNCYRIGNHLGIQPHAFKDSVTRPRGRRGDGDGDQGESLLQQEGRRDPLHHPLGRRLRHARHLHHDGLHDALPRARPRRHLQHLRLRGGQLRSLHLPRDAEEAQLQDVRRGEAPGGEVDPRRRVRPHVAGDPPVHGDTTGTAATTSWRSRSRRSPARSSRMPSSPRWSTSASSPPTSSRRAS